MVRNSGETSVVMTQLLGLRQYLCRHPGGGKRLASRSFGNFLRPMHNQERNQHLDQAYLSTELGTLCYYDAKIHLQVPETVIQRCEGLCIQNESSEFLFTILGICPIGSFTLFVAFFSRHSILRNFLLRNTSPGIDWNPTNACPISKASKEVHLVDD